MDLDELRIEYPTHGFAVYAFIPGDPVVLEVHNPDGTISAVARETLAECVAAAFPGRVRKPEPKAEEIEIDLFA